LNNIGLKTKAKTQELDEQPRMKSYKNIWNEKNKKKLCTKLSTTQGWNHVKKSIKWKNIYIYKIMNDLKFFICAIHKTSISRQLALPGYPATTTTTTTTIQGAELVIISRRLPHHEFLCVTFEPPLQRRNEFI
jgi:protoheme ferro-lyase